MRKAEFMQTFKLVFWDFDGVIKESVAVKTAAFVELFAAHGEAVAERVRRHHEGHGGMSRFEKIPLYMQWAGEALTPDGVQEHCRRFALLVRQAVIDAPWVPGVEAFLRRNPYRQDFVLVSATPQAELEEILAALRLDGCFSGVYGAPLAKGAAIRQVIETRGLAPQECLMVGDARADWLAAQENRVAFLLRRHASNDRVFDRYTGERVEDFTGLWTG